MRLPVVYTVLFVLCPFLACAVASAQASPNLDSVTVRFDYAGAEALLDAIQQPSIADADVTTLLEVRGVRAMVDNVTRYFKDYGPDQFRAELRTFPQNRARTGSPFNFSRAFRNREQVRSLMTDLKQNEAAIIRGMLQRLEPYRPHTGSLTATIYFVVGGSSDGFVPDRDDEPAFFVALDKASGDLDGVEQNATHELYHVMQKAAAKSVPTLAPIVRDPTRLAPPERLVATTLWEGTANYAADALKAEGTGPYLEMWRSRYKRNAEPARIKENFALFDTILSDLRAGRTTWEAAQRIGFNGDNDARLYFVGYEMAKAIERYEGANSMGELFGQTPAVFFQKYITLYRKHAEIAARFNSATEAYFAKSR